MITLWDPLRKACPGQDPFLSHLRFITCPTSGNSSRRVGYVLVRLHKAAVQLWSSHVISLNFRPKSEGKLFARSWTFMESPPARNSAVMQKWNARGSA